MKNLDKLAYDIVCDWHKVINFNPIHKGIDYSQIVRFYLWDKVGRAIRVKHNIDFNESVDYVQEQKLLAYYHLPLISSGKYKKKWYHKKKLLFIPFLTQDLLIEKISKNKEYRVISKEMLTLLGKRRIIKTPEFEYKGNWHEELYKAIIKSFEKLDIDLVFADKKKLKEQIKGTVNITYLAEKEIIENNPYAIYVHTDNHPPFINYVLVAKKIGIPTFTYQHGLDCEHYFLDDCYADNVAVWSENRKNRYIRDSRFQPKNYKVVGNVFLPKINSKNKPLLRQTILFITRPHMPIKCYSPSRNHLEGVKILEIILSFLLQNKDVDLIIKPHPMDSINNYKELIKNKALNDRVIISDKRLSSLFLKTDVVLTEDSTGGAEAMYYNLPCVHVHLANSEPVLPFVKYKCAFPGKSSVEILSSLKKAFNMTLKEKEELRKDQEKFIQDFIPIENINNLVSFITENIK